MGFATTALRLVTGATMTAHGLSKLTTTFGGGPEETAASFEKMGFTPGKQFGMVTGVAEMTGGALMVAGLGTPWACAMISGVMTGAIAKVHLKNGFWAAKNGYEFNLQILASTFAVAGAGGGALALDSLRGKKRRGLHWAVLQLALGAGAAAAALAVAERQASLQGYSSSPYAGYADASGTGPATVATDGLVDLVEDGAASTHGSAPSPVAAGH